MEIGTLYYEELNRYERNLKDFRNTFLRLVHPDVRERLRETINTPAASPFSPRELDLLNKALRYFESSQIGSHGKHRLFEPSEIDSLCERLSATKPESVNADLLTALKSMVKALETVDFSPLPGVYDAIPFAQAEAAIARAEAAQYHTPVGRSRDDAGARDPRNDRED